MKKVLQILPVIFIFSTVSHALTVEVSSIKTTLNLCLKEERTYKIQNACKDSIVRARELGVSESEIAKSLRGNFSGMKIVSEITAGFRPELNEGESVSDIIDIEVAKILLGE